MKLPGPVDLAAVFRKRLRAVLKEARELPTGAVLVHPFLPLDAAGIADMVATWDRGLRTWQTANPETWPAGLPLPLTVGEAVAAVRDGEAALVGELAAEVERCARELVAPEYLARVLARADVAERWPWPERIGRAEGAGAALYSLLTAAKRAGPGTDRVALMGSFYTQPWPGEAAPLDVARWVEPRLSRLSRLHAAMARDLVKMSGLGGLGSVTVDGARYPAAGLALLYLAERACHLVAPAAPRTWLLAVDPPPVRALTSLGGADPRNLDLGAKIDTPATADPSAPVELTFRWPDNTQLEIPWLPAGTGALVAVAQKYGQAAVRDMLALYLFTWAARAPADGTFWWWPDEHLDLLELADDAKGKARARLRRLWTDLNGATLTARYRSGAPLRGPLVARLNTDGTAQELRLHPALYRGVTGDDGTPGRHWWPMPVELLRLPAGGEHGRVHGLAVVLGSMWRAGLRADREGPPVAKVGAERLAAWLGVHKRTDRTADPRAGAALRTALDAGKDCGLVGDWEVERGDLDRLTGVVRATPGEGARAVVGLRAVERPAWVPATGDDLGRWLADAGLTSGAAGALLNLAGSTLRRVRSTYKGRPLPPEVRAALRRYLWPEPPADGGVH